MASANVMRSVPPFDEAALVAVRQWEYEVTTRGRQAGAGAPHRAHHVHDAGCPRCHAQEGIPELRQGVTPAFPAGQDSREAWWRS